MGQPFAGGRVATSAWEVGSWVRVAWNMTTQVHIVRFKLHVRVVATAVPQGLRLSRGPPESLRLPV